MKQIEKTAIILGATGLTGSYLLKALLADENYKKIKVFGRRSTEVQHPKLEEFIGDILHLENFEKDFTGDEVFCCIGTTKAKTPNKELYEAIDLGIPKQAAILAKKNNIPTFIVISALGANADSRIFYSQLKGKMEKAVINQSIPNTYIFQPSLIVGDRKEKRLAENMGNIVMSAIHYLLPKKYRKIHAKDLARAMQIIAQIGSDKIFISSEKIQNIAHS